MNEPYFLYVLLCKPSCLYTGIAKDPVSRLAEHLSRGKKCAKFTKSHPPIALKALFALPDKSSALKLEIAVKKLTRKQKEDLLLSRLPSSDFALSAASKLSPEETERVWQEANDAILR